MTIPLWLIGLLMFLVIAGITVGLAALQVHSRRVELADYVSLSALAKMVRLIFVLIVGLTLVLLGVAMMIGPGPGLLLILLGLAILATEFVWARVLLKRMQNTAKVVGDRVGFNAQTLPENASWFRRCTFHLGQGGRKLARWLRLDRLIAWMDQWLGISQIMQQNGGQTPKHNPSSPDQTQPKS